MLYYLDDGSLSNGVLEIATVNSELQLILQEYFKSYGLKFNIHKNHGVALQNKRDIISFLQIFLFPYKKIIPECMRYKMSIKI